MSKIHPTWPAETTAGLIAPGCLMAGDAEEEEEEEEDKKHEEEDEEDSQGQDEQNGYSE